MTGINLETARKVRRIAQLRQQKVGLSVIAQRLGCSTVNVWRLWKRWGPELDTLPTATEHAFTPLCCIQRRLALGWTTGDVARRAGVSRGSVWQFENEIIGATHRWRSMVEAALSKGEAMTERKAA